MSMKNKLSETAKKEVRERRNIQDLVKPLLKKWWRKEYLEGPPSRPNPLKCIVCGEKSKHGLTIHHIDPKIKKTDSQYNSYRNQAPLCGTCHNIITHKKGKPEDIIKEVNTRHNEAIQKRLLHA
jgi:hypothetical protein